MSATMTWIGLQELKDNLWALPADLVKRAAPLVHATAVAAAAEIRDDYPEGETGNLKRGVKVGSKGGRSQHTVRSVVRSTAPHAHLYETGTQTRQNRAGENRGYMFGANAPEIHGNWSQGPRQGANIFVPVIIRYRRQMYEDLIPILEEQGLRVRR